MERNMIRKCYRILCAISGGVDSAVAAFILKRQGYQVSGCFIKCWSPSDENNACQSEKDFQDAQVVCRKLDIPLYYQDYSKQYWTTVFQPFLKEYQLGRTPNPDILCNKHIKFGCFLNTMLNEGKYDCMATGHYAKLDLDTDNILQLMKCKDRMKDQTFFLSQVSSLAFQRVIFPLENFDKPLVRKIAKENGLMSVANKRDSTGICFIGRRSFTEFIDQYVELNPGPIECVDNGLIQSIQHQGIHRHTIGQRIKLQNIAKPYFVCGKDTSMNKLYVANSTIHRALYSDEFITDVPFWISGIAPLLPLTLVDHIYFKFQHIHMEILCENIQNYGNCLKVKLSMPLRAITPGQYAVFYRNECCLGSAKILETLSLRPGKKIEIPYTDKYLNRIQQRC
ncbi:hypothetical protein GJ496_003213 [Pomphorhynchus laevis]|nr:hypothetical protein GJ496_003213 [Pomphorhynchus laevis]